MGVQIRGGKAPGQNEPCLCGSGLKFKHCHGDLAKQVICNQAANECMVGLIQEEQKKRGLIPYAFTCEDCHAEFDTPDISLVEPKMSMCPNCNSVKLVKNKVGKTEVK
jgi:DNA-directed RNA polymerase subunit RPC12/RpoP